MGGLRGDHQPAVLSIHILFFHRKICSLLLRCRTAPEREEPLFFAVSPIRFFMTKQLITSSAAKALGRMEDQLREKYF